VIKGDAPVSGRFSASGVASVHKQGNISARIVIKREEAVFFVQ
jgi:hypothetical protein